MHPFHLWLLTRIGDTDYDETAGFVVRATTEAEAREFAHQQHPGESIPVWKDATLSTCVELEACGVPGIILEDFHAG